MTGNQEGLHQLVPKGMVLEQNVAQLCRVPNNVGNVLDVDAYQASIDQVLQPLNAPSPDHEAMESPQSMWGHRLRQNIRGRLLQRGVDIDLIDGLGSPPPRAQILPQDVPLPADDDMEEVKAAERLSSCVQDAHVWPIMHLQTINSHKPGICKLCTRTMTNITRHHVHPKVGRESRRRPPPGITDCTDKYLSTTIDICRPCHSMVHHIIPNELMSNSYYSLELLESHPRVKAWISWVRRQPIPSPRPFRRPAPSRVHRSAAKLKATSLKLRTEKVEVKRKGPRLNLIKTREALENIWNDSGNIIPRSCVEISTLQAKVSEMNEGARVRAESIRKAMACIPEYREWYNYMFSTAADAESGHNLFRRSSRMAARRAPMEDGEKTRMIKDALGTIWRENGNDFPRYDVEKGAKGRALREAVRFCMRKGVNANFFTKFYVEDLQECMQLDKTYRVWYEWTYPESTWVQGGIIIQSGSPNEDEDDDPDDEMGSVDAPVGYGLKHGELAVHSLGTGTASRIDPIILDLTDEEDKSFIASGHGNLTVSRSGGRVVIDLTMEDEDEVDIEQLQHVNEDSDVLSGFFFDLGSRQGPCLHDRYGAIFEG